MGVIGSPVTAPFAHVEMTLTEGHSEYRVREMIAEIVGHSAAARVENIIAVLCALLGAGILVLLFAVDTPFAAKTRILLIIMVMVNLAPPVFLLWQRRRRSAAMLDLVMPADGNGRRSIDRQAYALLAAEYRAVEEAEFRKALARSIRRQR